ncbi:TonB-dependent receptor plug domain-containing protein [Flavobacterium sp. Fl-318]|uniref:TonB-dependent receptor plug domain-containing protein n=1 Tax=Flavobacterium cupriresistens TaxID=2893885 RepID=A0ABU4R6V3_9FLAO|nr:MULTISPECIES: TonB-dependent receptor plug domain-containing protein [unclassified Flavobacterium]MDX6188316.1 TonB-dependent receptor plug domain-containing protein [Flavobacterium sp. Fl-318]UFH40643.1 TonB-dependent receptor plug domain-containing protein [Flavobacterium sp. F-323]
MKNILYAMFLLVFQTVLAQDIEKDWDKIYRKPITEKVYLQLNNVLYAPGETIYFKGFVTESDNSPSTLSDFVYVDLFDSGNKKVASQIYVVENGSVACSYRISENAAAGMYKIKAYTRIQKQTSENIFERTVFVQKVVTPRILMTLDFKKKSYGKGETCEADFELKNLENQAIKYQVFKYDVFIAGRKIDSLEGKTDELGKAIIHFKLPNDLKSNDGIVNVMLDYDNFKESVTRAIPIDLNFVDLQFLPESGNFILNEISSLFFIAKNEFGLPMDVGGYIEDENGTKVTDFTTTHDGMGKVFLKTEKNKKYVAVVTSPFKSQKKITLPEAGKNVFTINAQKTGESVALNIYAPLAIDGNVLVRNTSKIHKSVKVNLEQGWNTVTIKTENFPVGIQSFSLVIEKRVVAERLVFLNYQEGLKIEIKTDKSSYLPREKVEVSVLTKDKNNDPISSSLSVSVVDSKLLTYIDDKQDTILSWLLLGSELKGKIHEPRFYFDDTKKTELKEEAIDLLLNTHGWRKYSQKEIQKLMSEREHFEPEKSDILEGFVLNNKEKPVAVKVMFFTDQGKVFETKSNSSGYFNFNRVVFSDFGCLITESRKLNEYTIKSSISNQADFLRMKDTLSNTSSVEINYKVVNKENTVEKTTAHVTSGSNSVSLNSDQALLESVVVTAYGYSFKKQLSSSVTVISAQEIARSLSGRAAGIQITSGSGQPGASDKVVIRGYSSLYGNRAGGQPLIIVDGIPYPNNENSSVLGNLPPDSINSIAILKDASATTLYGSGGANGVILITTKKKLQQGNILLGGNYNYSFQNISKSGTRELNEAESFYKPIYSATTTEEKSDFRSCIYWNSIIQTNNKGVAYFGFYNSDDNTSFKIIAEGTSYKGDIGKSEAVFSVRELIQCDLKIPVYTSQEDVILMPLWLKNNSENSLKLNYKMIFDGKENDNFKNSFVVLNPNESKTVYITLIPNKMGENISLEIVLEGENFKTKIKKTISVYAKGFPMNIDIAGTKSQDTDFSIFEPMPSSIDSGVKFFFNPFSAIFDGLEGMMREPSGCFEQVSSSNYPNIMAMQLLKYKNTAPEFKNKALKFLESGYKKLKNYESKGGGFEWYGGDPGNEALTAYGLLQFNEMKEFINVDEKMIERTTNWLYSRKDGLGGFKQNSGRYGFSGIKYEVNNAYIVYVLSEIGEDNIKKEYEKGLEEALKSNDLYRMELMALASFNLKKVHEYKQLMSLIKTKIDKLGLKDLKAEQTVISSNGKSKTIEISSLYALALLKEKQVTKEVTDVLDYIQSSNSIYGFGSTQATALALKAITEFTKIYSNSVTVAVPKMNLNRESIDLRTKDNSGNVIVGNLKINAGTNNFSVQIPENNTIPYLFYVKYNTYTPNNSKKCKLLLKTNTLTNKLKISETARLEIEIQNKSAEQVSNPIARIGIPGGLTPEPWQLKLLVEKNNIDYYEIFGSELVLYFRKLEANEIRKINIDLKAIVPGKYKGVASSAYLYYENEHKNWNQGVEIEVIP